MAGEGMRNTFEGDGSYRPDSGKFDDMAGKPEIDPIRANLSSIGLGDFKAGDQAMIHIKVTVGEVGEDGMAELQPIRVTADPMDSGAMRERARQPKMDMSGTNL